MTPAVAARIDARVTDVAMLGADIKRVEFAAANGAPLPVAAPGAHVDLWLPDGKVRQYSVVHSAADGSVWQIAVQREPRSRGGSAYIVERLGRGQTVQLSPPKNHFALDESGDEYLLIAGGIGMTPLLPMALRLASIGKRLTLHYLARSRERAALLDLLGASPLTHVVQPHFSDEHGPADVRALLGPPRAGLHVYVCGPARLIDGVLDAAAGWPSGAVHFERFAAPTPAPDERHDARAFDIELARTGRCLTVPPDRSMLDVLRDACVPIASVCTQGVCGSCAVALLAGEADHRDALQTDVEKAQNKVVYVCVSRAKSARLVLDL